MKINKWIYSLVAASVWTYGYAGNIYIAPTVFLEQIQGHYTTYRDLNPRISLGYADMPGDIYWSAELFVVPFTGSLSSTQSNNVPSARSSTSYGASFIPGYMVSDRVLGFVRLGFITTKFSSPDAMKTGGQAGIGFLTPISASFSLRGEYDYTAYHSIHGMGSLKSNQIGLGILYKFDN